MLPRLQYFEGSGGRGGSLIISGVCPPMCRVKAKYRDFPVACPTGFTHLRNFQFKNPMAYYTGQWLQQTGSVAVAFD